MKKRGTAILLAVMAMGTTCCAAEIPRESAPICASEEQIVLVEGIIGDILDEVKAGNLAYAEAAGYANTRVRKAVVAGETGGHGYGILSAITDNAILTTRDIYLRPQTYEKADAYLRVLLADLIEAVHNGKPYAEALDEAYLRMYTDANAQYITDPMMDMCYMDKPTVDSAMYHTARRLLAE